MVDSPVGWRESLGGNLRSFGGVAGVVATVLVLASCSGQTVNEAPNPPEDTAQTLQCELPAGGGTAGGETAAGGEAQGAQSATVGEITSDPGQFYGDRVTVTSEVSEVIGNRAFVLGDELGLIGLRPLPDLVPENLSSVEPGTQVRATGTVCDFNAFAIEQELGYGVEDRRFDRFEGEPVLVASEVTLNP